MMISLHSILAAGDIAKKLPTVYLILAGILVGIAFTIGFIKGFRKVGWNGLTWATAGLVFVIVSRLISPDGSVTKRFVFAMLIALACIAGVLALYGLLAYYLRPKIRWVKDNVNGDTSLAEYGLEFEPEYLDYDGEDDWQPYGKRIHRTGFTPPNFAFRLLGGLACAINVGIILWTIASAVLLAINSTSLIHKNMGLILQVDSAKKFLEYAQIAFFEFMSIGIVILVAKKGYTNGWLNTIRMLIISVGSLGVVIGCIYLPFSGFASNTSGMWYFLSKFVNRCVSLMKGKFPSIGVHLGKLLAGGCLSAVGIIVMIVLNIILKKCCRLVSKSAPTRIVDTILSCLLYMVIGAVVCVGVWFVLAAMDHCNIFNISDAMSYEGAHLSNGLYNFAKMLVEKLLQKI